MKLRCYTEKSGKKIRIELCGTMLEGEKWKFLRDSCVMNFSAREWATGVMFPNDRKILIMLKKTPTKKQWKVASEYWLNVMEANRVGVDLIDDGIVYYTKINDYVESKNGKIEPKITDDVIERTCSEPIPYAVHQALQKSFYDKIDEVMDCKAIVREAKQKYDEVTNELLLKQSNLRAIASFLDSSNAIEDGDETKDWENMAVEKGALEER